MKHWIPVISLLVVVLLPSLTRSQSHEWWAENVNWDGITHWSRYITISPGHMGPNALPVPKLSTGAVQNQNYLGISSSLHLRSGDQTINPTLYGNYAFVKDKVSFDFHWVPVEFFKQSHTLKTERKVFHEYYDVMRASGDIYLNTRIQIMSRQKTNLGLRLGYKFATSNKIGAARFTDSPGYYFDLSAGYLLRKTSNSELRMLGMMGFYAWQTNKPHLLQDDAFLTGLGIRWTDSRVETEASIRSYIGYMNNGDKPVIALLKSSYRLEKISLSASIQQGLHDYKYTSFETGFYYYW